MRGLIFVALSGALALACEGTTPSAAAPSAAEPDEPELTPASGIAEPRRAPPSRMQPPARVRPLALTGEREAYVLSGARGRGTIAFLHGMCGHGLGPLQSFQRAAAEHGLAVAPTGDTPCSRPGQHSWSHDLESIDAQIVEALRAAGSGGEPRGVTLIGYSLGASRAEQLARNYPERYRALVLIGAPAQPSPHRLAHLSAAAMVAGERDRQDLMKKGARAFDAAGVRSKFFELPEAAHGQMGPASERVMREVLEWLRLPTPPAR
jgi:predicted esterase